MPKGGRSTRDKILRNTDAAVHHVDVALSLMQRVDLRAEDGSAHINEHMPFIVTGLEAVGKLLVSFRAGL